MIVPLAKQLVAEGEKLIVFRNMRGPAQGCARYLSKELGLPPATGVIAVLPTQDLTAASQDLRACFPADWRLEDGVIYRVRFRDFNGHGKDEFMDILHLAGIGGARMTATRGH